LTEDGSALMEHPQTNPPMPAAYYRWQAVRVSRLVSEATTPAIKQRLRDLVGQYERLAERVELSVQAEDDHKG
jgi:hypothetical protein